MLRLCATLSNISQGGTLVTTRLNVSKVLSDVVSILFKIIFVCLLLMSDVKTKVLETKTVLAIILLELSLFPGPWSKLAFRRLMSLKRATRNTYLGSCIHSAEICNLLPGFICTENIPKVELKPHPNVNWIRRIYLSHFPISIAVL